MLSEDEIIEVITYKLNMKNTDVYAPILYDEIQSLLNLYKTQKEELEYYKQKEKDEFEERDRWE